MLVGGWGVATLETFFEDCSAVVAAVEAAAKSSTCNRISTTLRLKFFFASEKALKNFRKRQLPLLPPGTSVTPDTPLTF